MFELISLLSIVVLFLVLTVGVEELHEYIFNNK